MRDFSTQLYPQSDISIGQKLRAKQLRLCRLVIATWKKTATVLVQYAWNQSALCWLHLQYYYGNTNL